jgi:hypothetical protein
MLQAAMVLVPCGDRLQVEHGSVAEDVSIVKEKDNKEYMGYEKHVRAGSFRGRVELQVLRPKQGSSDMLFTGVLLRYDEI